MKKNRMMRLASILLVCVLLTTSIIGGTFAKYTTSDSSKDSARVAKWGFEATANSITLDDLFQKSYDLNASDATVTSTSSDVIAPGTANEESFSFAYDTTSNNVAAPEVDYTFVVDVATSGTTTNLDANENFKWTLNGTQYDTLAELEAAIEKLDGDATKYDAGELPEAFYGSTPNGAATHTIGWVWLFDKDVTGAEDQDELDTQMGNADTLENVEITITITATQVD